MSDFLFTYDEERNYVGTMVATMLYIFFILFFHLSELVLVIRFNPKELSFQCTYNNTLQLLIVEIFFCTALLIQRDYIIALVISAIEHALWWIFLPEVKGYYFITAIGAAVVVSGELTRHA